MSWLTTIDQEIISNKPYSASRNFIVSAILWLVLGVTLGTLAGALMTWPDLIKGIGPYPLGVFVPHTSIWWPLVG